MTHPKFTPEDIEKFWSRVDQTSGADACWPWLAGKFSEGYGAFRHGEKTLKASRIAFFLTHGFWPVCACHRCDHPPCCNPEHIYDGTPADNTADMVRRNRVCRTHGEGRWVSKLTNEQVMQIRQRYANGESGMVLAPDYGITFQNVSWIVRGKSWAHLPLIPREHRGPVDRVPIDLVLLVERRRHEGASYGEIVKETGLGKTTVARIAHRMGLGGKQALHR